jgi:FkbM family methyltransferase
LEIKKYYGQYDTDKHIASLFNHKTEGYFVDIGAWDGIGGSNTYFFEKCGWDGVCIEPMPIAYEKMVSSRSCECIRGVISDMDSEECDFVCVEGEPSMLSGLPAYFDKLHEKRIDDEVVRDGGVKKNITVKNYKFNDIIKETRIDLLDVDTEGSELSIIMSIDHNKYDIGLIVVENNFSDIGMRHYIINLGKFAYVGSSGVNDFFINNRWEEFKNVKRI